MRPQGEPARIADEQVGLNGRIAATLTRFVGSMWTVYATLAIVLTWMVLGLAGPLRSVDPFPFPFMLLLGNLVQLVLCFAILVGQRVLGSTADRRAVQTYESAEAIFQEVSGLQDHLGRQDRALSRGVMVPDSSPHPWIHEHSVQNPPQATDQAVGFNGRIAAWMTRRMGSMWAFYTAAIFQLAWMGLAQAHVLRFDGYPFPFLLFLSSLVQLLSMLVILVGQEVLALAGDRRSEQTFLDAQAILHECRRMEEHLTVQDRVIGSLSAYVLAHVTEQLAQTIHRLYVEARQRQGEPLRPTLLPWDELSEDVRESNREQARHVGRTLAARNCVLMPTDFDPSITFDYSGEEEVMELASSEHERWVRERRSRGFDHGPAREGRTHPDLVDWDELSAEAREKDAQFIRELPGVLASAGFQVLRLHR